MSDLNLSPTIFSNRPFIAIRFPIRRSRQRKKEPQNLKRKKPDGLSGFQVSKNGAAAPCCDAGEK
jgi:hypothetical protein